MRHGQKKKKSAQVESWEAKLVQYIALDSIFQNAPPEKKEPLSQEMHLKIQLLSRGLKLSNSKPCCRVSALYFFILLMPPMSFRHKAHSDKCFFKLFFYSRINPCFTAWRQRGVWNCHETCKYRKPTIFISIVYALHSDNRTCPPSVLWEKAPASQGPLHQSLIISQEQERPRQRAGDKDARIARRRVLTCSAPHTDPHVW